MDDKILINKPGLREIEVLFDQKRIEKKVVVVVEAFGRGEYFLKLVANHLVGDNKGSVRIKVVAKNGAAVKVEGMVRIAKGANGVDDFLDMRGLILDGVSQIEMKPMLEIEANDVKASHAAAVSKIDEEQLFYLQSRGVSEKEAEKLIIKGFLDLE